MDNSVFQFCFYFCIISLGHTCWLPFPLLSVRLSHHPLFVLACRIVELFPAVPINPHWGIVSKCLTYSKAACDPFVYSLLRHQYRKTCTDIINRLLKRSSLNASGPRQVNQVNSIPTAEWQEADWWGSRSEGSDPGKLSGKMWSCFIVDEEENKYWVCFLSTSAWIWSDMPKKKRKKEKRESQYRQGQIPAQ